MRDSHRWLDLVLVLPLDVFCEASVCALLEILQSSVAVFNPFKSSHEPGSALLGVLAASLAFAVLLKMLALRAFVVVTVRLQVGFADPQLASGMWRGFGDCLPLAQGRKFEPYAWVASGLVRVSRLVVR